MLLCRQQQIDTVMLAFDDPRASPRPRPWLPAVLIEDQLYLFDTELGLPIRVPGGGGIATLAQVRQDSGILRSLDIGQRQFLCHGRRRLFPVGGLDRRLARGLVVPPQGFRVGGGCGRAAVCGSRGIGPGQTLEGPSGSHVRRSLEHSFSGLGVSHGDSSRGPKWIPRRCGGYGTTR